MKYNFNDLPQVSASEYFVTVSGKIEEKLSKFMIDYLELFEPEDYERVFEYYPNRIQKEIDNGNEPEAKELVNRMQDIWMKLIAAMNQPKDNKDVKNIHAKKRDMGMDTYTYRNILMQQAGKQSCATMKMFEMKLALNGLERYRKGELEVTAWDGRFT